MKINIIEKNNNCPVFDNEPDGYFL